VIWLSTSNPLKDPSLHMFTSLLYNLKNRGRQSKGDFSTFLVIKCSDYRDTWLYFTKKGKSKPNQVKTLRSEKSSVGVQGDQWRFSLFHYLYFLTVANNHIPIFHIKYNALN